MPLLAVERDLSTLKAVFFVPGAPFLEQPRWIFPAGKEELFAPAFWPSLIELAGLPKPEVVLAACHEGLSGKEAGNPDLAGRIPFWQGLFAEAKGRGIDFSSLLVAEPPAHWARLNELSRPTGSFVCDSMCARVMGVMARPERLERSYRHGITCIYLDRFIVGAYLVFQGRLFGALELPRNRATQEVLLAELEEFRLGWLPLERAAALGGLSFVDVNLPAEAEGFKPLFAVGPEAKLLDGQAKIVSSDGNGAFWGCFGLLHKYSFVHTP